MGLRLRRRGHALKAREKQLQPEGEELKHVEGYISFFLDAALPVRPLLQSGPVI